MVSYVSSLSPLFFILPLLVLLLVLLLLLRVHREMDDKVITCNGRMACSGVRDGLFGRLAFLPFIRAVLGNEYLGYLVVFFVVQSTSCTTLRCVSNFSQLSLSFRID